MRFGKMTLGAAGKLEFPEHPGKLLPMQLWYWKQTIDCLLNKLELSEDLTIAPLKRYLPEKSVINF